MELNKAELPLLNQHPANTDDDWDILADWAGAGIIGSYTQRVTLVEGVAHDR